MGFITSRCSGNEPTLLPLPLGKDRSEPINNTEIYGRSRVKVKVEPRLTFYAWPLYIASILLTDVNFTCVAWKSYARVEINPTY